MEISKKVKGKKIWTTDEDKMIKSLVQANPRLDWEWVARKINEGKDSNKTAKQCRERFRNYLEREESDPIWQPNEKLLFALLYPRFGNKWMTLAKFLKKKTDIAIKNYYYQVMRKAVGHLCENSLKNAAQSSLPQLYTLLTSLEIIRKRYFRGVARKSSANREYNEKIIIKLIRSRKLTGTQIEKYEDMLITTLLKEKGEADFPLIINLDPQGLLLEHDVMQELLNILKEKAGQKVEAYIQIRVIENPKQELDLHSRPELSPLPEIKEWSQEKPFSKNEQNLATMVVPQNRILTLPLPIFYPSSQSQPSPALTFSQFSPFYHKHYPHPNSNKRYFSNIQRIPSIIGSPMDVQNGNIQFGESLSSNGIDIPTL